MSMHFATFKQINICTLPCLKKKKSKNITCSKKIPKNMIM